MRKLHITPIFDLVPAARRAAFRAALAVLVVGGFGALAALGTACGDPAHDDDVASLGPEGSAPPGPLHRPGQPCVVCHGGRGPAKAQFSLGGTIYDSPYDPMSKSNVLSAVNVTLTDSTMKTHKTATNAAGNFFVHVDEWAPAYPVHVQLDYTDGTTQTMVTHIGRDGSCAGCHHDPSGTASPGHVYLLPMTPPATP